ncbi:MAG: hypothetical protein A3J62_02210 [Candidatus Buchananbacteria bacterium RIFCSPHIGHO2_02_FULL_38_8]|uniref:Type 4 fimbrial biogenesis protein PilX N-terminal domain-containing protein n=1 Tax=Candidatus Buchananbacteria bacterium RIFCSPHIGHO2_02_FULL_38_8 TaxID=1797538 RepID=A0A1G1Y4D8_9BACT|nr:hypothetical protein [uncultured bacterium]OGY47111.1 MAG: hypothetical protein A3J62_02210 [Candidatus Buchananbacteria bacterium RIFCSPHIGHO2_02_FULL_38_8]
MITKFQNPRSKFQNGGYIALVALLIVAAAGLTIGIAVSLRGIEEIQTSFGDSQSAKAKSIANVCIEDGLERLRNNWADYSSSLSVGENSCIISIVTNGNSATLNATGTVDIYSQKIKVEANNNFDVTLWQEY